MRRAILTVGFLVLSAAPAFAGYSHMGVGTASCTVFGQQYLKNPTLAEQVFFSWAQGFMSGLNEMLIRQKSRTKDLQSLSLDEQKSRLRRYCAANPNATYRTGVLTMFLALADNRSE